MANILIVYYYKSEYPIRATSADHLYCFKTYSEHNCFYLNVAVRRVPSYLRRVKFDLVVYTTLFLSGRWDRNGFRETMRRIEPLKSVDAVKVALPQDEFLNTDLLCDFINEFRIDHVFSVAPQSEWKTIYPNVDRERVRFSTVLTGYLDEHTVKKINELAGRTGERTIDVGYRAWRGAPWLGRHGILKAEIADVFEAQGPSKGLVTDVSTRPEDTFLGDAWYEFMLRCKYIIGVEGGASIIDRDGSLRKKTDEYTKEHPSATFDEIEANCFPGLDGSLKLFAISPRHLEACATRTCQVLVEGHYNGILEPGRHYIELKRDFSNLEEVLESIRRDDLRAEITKRAYREIVETGKYTYESFVRELTGESLQLASTPVNSQDSKRARPLFWWMRMADRISWAAVMLNWYVVVSFKRRARSLLLKIFPEQTYSVVVHRLKGKPEI
ncbi:MAG: glycosyltransferase family 1 protein [Pyrinomonadaceae bacterium]|nr:glycosyltransferase family 1 protein [Pyrinomonadaceae bacterium]